jgi:hypothetical protein
VEKEDQPLQRAIYRSRKRMESGYGRRNRDTQNIGEEWLGPQ